LKLEKERESISATSNKNKKVATKAWIDPEMRNLEQLLAKKHTFTNPLSPKPIPELVEYNLRS